MTLSQHKKTARALYKDAKTTYERDRETVHALLKTDCTPAERKKLRADLKKSKKRMEANRKAWKEAVAREKASRAKKSKSKHEQRLGEKADHPAPEGFEFVMLHKKWWMAVVDPNWNPPKTQCRMLGRYDFGSLNDPKVSTKATITVKVNSGASDAEAKHLVLDYFGQEACRVYFGNVRVLAFERSQKPYHRDEFYVRFSTDHNRIKGFIKEK